MPYKDHYVKRKIEEINPETDLKVKIMGFVVDKKDDTVILDDGSKKAKVFVDNITIVEKMNINQLIRIFGSTLPTDEGFEIKADVVQDLSNLNINLYKKVEELYNKMGV
jgi:RNase P/RNase MRP subunit p29